MKGGPRECPAVGHGIVLRALANLGITARVGERNGLYLGVKKISGSAFREGKGRSLHHGTLLIASDLAKLQAYLAPPNPDFSSRGTPSVRSPVAKLEDVVPGLDYPAVCDEFIGVFQRHHGGRASVETLTESDLRSIPQVVQHYQKLRRWQWQFGETPRFTRRVDKVLEITAHKGKIYNVAILADGLSSTAIRHLQGRRYCEREIATVANFRI